MNRIQIFDRTPNPRLDARYQAFRVGIFVLILARADLRRSLRSKTVIASSTPVVALALFLAYPGPSSPCTATTSAGIGRHASRLIGGVRGRLARGFECGDDGEGSLCDSCPALRSSGVRSNCHRVHAGVERHGYLVTSWSVHLACGVRSSCSRLSTHSRFVSIIRRLGWPYNVPCLWY